MFFRNPTITTKLSEEKTDDCLQQVAEWVEKEWGYLRNFPGVEKRRELMREIADEVYLIKHMHKLIGIFRLTDTQLDGKLEKKELTHVYVSEEFRNQGWGKKVIEIAKNTAKSEGIDLIELETLKPELNQFYEKLGAKNKGSTEFMNQPATKLEIKFEPR